MSDTGALWPLRAAGSRCDVLGIGQVAVDDVLTLDALPPVGGKREARHTAQLPGGQVATAVLACARLGLRTAYVGCVGEDAEALLALAPLRSAGVDLDGVRWRAGVRTQRAQIWIEAGSGERTIAWFRDPSLALSAQELRRADVEGARALHLDAGDLDAALWAAEVARGAGVAVVLDADRVGEGIERLLPLVDFPVVSQEFAETYGGTSSVRRGLARLCENGARMAVVTLGASGALAQCGDRILESPAYAVDARDTTGAGDAFHAGLLWGLLEGRNEVGVLRAAHAVAALNCMALGAQGGLPDRASLEAFLAGARPAPWRDPEP